MESKTKSIIIPNLYQVTNDNYVVDLRPYDVLLGRGTGPNCYHGNIAYRSAVEALKPSYVATTSRIEKRCLIRKILTAVKSKNGRFLQKLKRREVKALGLPPNVVYKVTTDDTAIEKVKQALRYITYKKCIVPAEHDKSSKESYMDEDDKDEEDKNELKVGQYKGTIDVKENKQAEHDETNQEEKKDVAVSKKHPTFAFSSPECSSKKSQPFRRSWSQNKLHLSGSSYPSAFVAPTSGLCLGRNLQTFIKPPFIPSIPQGFIELSRLRSMYLTGAVPHGICLPSHNQIYNLKVLPHSRFHLQP